MNHFREARLKAKLSQKAAAISVGVKSPSMSDWETGKSNPSIENLIAMSNLYNVSIDYLLGNTDADSIAPAAASSNTSQKQPVNRDELLGSLVEQVTSLPTSHLIQMKGYLDGLKASQGSSAPASSDHPSTDPTDP